MKNSRKPYFLYSGDHSGLALVSHLLTGSNYSTLSCAMLMALNAKNMLSFVDGSIPQPNVDEPTARIWSRCNSMVSS